jgi:hypothetical protein
MSPSEQFHDWCEFYLGQFNVKLEPTPELRAGPPGFDRLIVVTPEVTLNQVLLELKSRFGVSSDIASQNELAPGDRGNVRHSQYVIWIRQRVEADVEMANVSANELSDNGIKGITLLERLLFELKYYLETGKHLDVEGNVTLCAGSRGLKGCVPEVYWTSADGRLYIEWCTPYGKNRELRTRAVSL